MEFNLTIQYVISVVATFFPFWQICKRAGLNRNLSFLLLIPGAGMLVLIIILAFKDWPVLNKNKS